MISSSDLFFRSVKGSELTYDELDSNFTILRDAINVGITPASLPSSNYVPVPDGETRSHYSTTFINNKVYVFGGYSSLNTVSDSNFYIYDFATGIWIDGPVFPGQLPLTEPIVGSIGTDIYVIGGSEQDFHIGWPITYYSVFKFDTLLNSWSTLPSIDYALSNANAIEWMSGLIWMGGFGTNGSGQQIFQNMFRYTPGSSNLSVLDSFYGACAQQSILANNKLYTFSGNYYGSSVNNYARIELLGGGNLSNGSPCPNFNNDNPMSYYDSVSDSIYLFNHTGNGIILQGSSVNINQIGTITNPDYIDNGGSSRSVPFKYNGEIYFLTSTFNFKVYNPVNDSWRLL